MLYEILISEQEYELLSSECPPQIFSTKLEIQIALTLLYLGSNFREWYTYRLCNRYGNSLVFVYQYSNTNFGSLLLLRNQFGIM